MKKSIIVLLIAVLVAGFAFAGTLKGYAALEFNVDLNPLTADKGTWGFANLTESKYSFSFEFDTTKVEVKGEGDLWAELAIEGSATLKVSNSTPASPVKGKYTVKLSKANIHIGEDITIGILNEGEGPEFAWSYRVDDAGDPTEDYIYDDHEAANIGGFTVTYKEWYGGFGAKGRWDTDPAQFTFYGHGATPEFKFAEEQIIVQAGGYAGYANNTNVFTRASFVGAGAKAEYAADKLNAYVGGDVRYDDGAVGFEALAKASFAFAEEGTVGVDAYVVDKNSYGHYDTLYLNARAWAEYTLAASDDIEVYMYAEADASDLLVKDAREVEIYAEQSTTIDKIGISLDETYKIFAKSLRVNAKVDYTAEKFYAWAKVGAGFSFGSDPALVTLPFECGIKSEAIIDKAEIGLKYTQADFAKTIDPDKIDDAGLVTAYVKIGFDSSK